MGLLVCPGQQQLCFFFLLFFFQTLSLIIRSFNLRQGWALRWLGISSAIVCLKRKGASRRMRGLFFLRFFFLSSERQQSSNELIRNHDCSPIGSVRLPIDSKPIATRRDQSYYCRQMFDMDTIYPSIGSISVCVWVCLHDDGNSASWLFLQVVWKEIEEQVYRSDIFEILWNLVISFRKKTRKADDILYSGHLPLHTWERRLAWRQRSAKKKTWCLKVVRLLLSISHEQGHVCVCGLDKNRIISFGSRQKLAHARRNHLT